MSRFRELCEGTTKRGTPCTRSASHTYDGGRYCVHHGDPRRRFLALQNVRRRKWTVDELETLYRLTERGVPDVEIARRYGVTVGAIRMTRHLYGLTPPLFFQTDARDVAKMFGVCPTHVYRWIRDGRLRASRGIQRGRQTTWRVDYDDIVAFARDERSWHLWSPEKVTRRELLLAANRPASLRFYSTPEVAAIVGVAPLTPRKWCQAGWLRSERNGRDFRVRSDWLDEFRKVYQYGDGIGLHRKEQAA